LLQSQSGLRPQPKRGQPRTPVGGAAPNTPARDMSLDPCEAVLERVIENGGDPL